MMKTSYIKIKDLDKRGGGFIREKRLGTTPSGELYSGTVYYNNGKSATVKAIINSYGSGQIIGTAENTEECRKAFKDFMEYMGQVKPEKKSKNTLYKRALLDIGINAITLLALVSLATDIIDINPVSSIWNAAYLIMEVTRTVLIAKIGSLIKEI